MNTQELWAHYDRFLEQIRFDTGEMYKLYSFFFAIDSALLAAVFLKQIDLKLIEPVAIAGIVISIYWFFVTYKQKTWRDFWIEKLKVLEGKLGIPNETRMWPREYPPLRKQVFGIGRLWFVMLTLPFPYLALFGLIALWAWPFFNA